MPVAIYIQPSNIKIRRTRSKTHVDVRRAGKSITQRPPTNQLIPVTTQGTEIVFAVTINVHPTPTVAVAGVEPGRLDNHLLGVTGTGRQECADEQQCK